jgi:hypothetical protein
VQTSLKSRRDFSARQPTTHSQAPSPLMSDGILAAFDHACEQNELEVAALSLIEYERVVTRVPINLGPDRRREMESLIAAHSRLWELLRAYAAE